MVTDTGRRYILQRINDAFFRDEPGLMGKISLVIDHLLDRTCTRFKLVQDMNRKWDAMMKIIRRKVRSRFNAIASRFASARPKGRLKKLLMF